MPRKADLLTRVQHLRRIRAAIRSPPIINPPAGVEVRRVVEDGKLLMQADVSVSPAEPVDESECPQEPPIIDETEQRGEIAPLAAKNEHLRNQGYSIAEMEIFLKLAMHIVRMKLIWKVVG